MGRKDIGIFFELNSMEFSTEVSQKFQTIFASIFGIKNNFTEHNVQGDLLTCKNNSSISRTINHLVHAQWT